jgi:hypothetical protein
VRQRAGRVYRLALALVLGISLFVLGLLIGYTIDNLIRVVSH